MAVAPWPSVYFTAKELACQDGTPYPEKWRASRLPILLHEADEIRVNWYAPLVVTSGFRTDRYNAKIGGAKDSQHPQGRALDLRPRRSEQKAGWQRAFWRVVVVAALRPDSKIRYVKLYSWGAHIDTRPSKWLKIEQEKP